jgi:hypothetical protein
MSTRRVILVSAVIFGLISLAIYWPTWPGDPHRIVGCTCADPTLQSWFLAWTPWALVHGHNPFFTTYMNYPQGVNLAANTLMPLLGLIAAPVTLSLGASTSFSLLMWLAFPLSGISALWVIRRWTSSTTAVVVGGALSTFSPYLVHQGFGHLNLAFVPLPPLIFYVVSRIVNNDDGRATRWGLALGGLVVAQYFISS